MVLKTVFVRFYKSFNYDYLRKFNEDAKPDPWDMIENMWYPYVRVPLHPKVTTIVGANESGKSHLLSAIKAGLSGEEIERGSFCRYSQFFNVEIDKLRFPDFGFEWTGINSDEQKVVEELVATKLPGDSFFLFRVNKTELQLYQDRDIQTRPIILNQKQIEQISKYIPSPFIIKPDLGLPDSIPLRYLSKNGHSKFDSATRQSRMDLFERILTESEAGKFKSAQSVNQNAQAIADTFGVLSSHGSLHPSEAHSLARDLLCEVARIDPKAFQELYDAIKRGAEGHVEGLIQNINEKLESSLNFPKWWVQDRNFKLRVSPRENDLVFTIRDRTETDYSFGERSSGLRYFLSYYAQYRAHKERVDGRPEILLMDEPDTYLSSQAQQDLLKIFHAFAEPETSIKPVQVVYVTHSPFLIDKNHAERICVLEKGVGDEGTRVVRDAGKNHYEPLRSAFGAYVAETTFIGNCNLIVEGLADQVLLANLATMLRLKGLPSLCTLDLNNLTIVPAGSASHIPYLVYLAKGRDIEQPAVVVMLDSDTAGNDAKALLGRGGPKRKQLLPSKYILSIADLAKNTIIKPAIQKRYVDTEDLIPLPICVKATIRYLTTVCGLDESVANRVDESQIRAGVKENVGIFAGIQACVATVSNGSEHIEKVGFMRAVIDCIRIENASLSPDTTLRAEIQELENNFRELFSNINLMIRSATRELTQGHVSEKIKRLKKSFKQDFTVRAKKEQAIVLLENMDAALDDSDEADILRMELQRVRKNHELDHEIGTDIKQFVGFISDLDKLHYAPRLKTQEADVTEPALNPIEKK